MLLDGERRFSYDNPKVEEMIKEVKEPLSRLYELYGALNTSGDSKAPIDAQASGTDMENGKDKDDSEWRSPYKKYLKGKYGTKLTIQDDRYLSGTNEFFRMATSNNLKWWKVCSQKYPILIARDLFFIRVSEFSFNTDGRILDLFQSSLGLETVQAVICLHNWLQSSAAPVDNFTQEMEINDLIESGNNLKACCNLSLFIQYFFN